MDGNDETDMILWFELNCFIDCVWDVRKNLMWVLSTWISIDEIIVRFMDISIKTYRIRNKPVLQDYNFYVVCASDRFVINFTNDRQAAENKDWQEYIKESSGKTNVG